MDIPFDEIKETLDRSWSSRLVELIQSPETDDEIAIDAMDALSDLIDPAITDRLFSLATDPNQDRDVRIRATDVICDSGLCLEKDELRAWWDSGDEILQAVALEDARRGETDFLRSVASDPLHPLYLHAIRGLEDDFDEPEWQSYVVTALSHFDPTVQDTAAKILVWEEPIAAEDGLINLAKHGEGDTAYNSMQTLKFYSSRRALTTFAELLDHDDIERADDARDALEKLCDEFIYPIRFFEAGSKAREAISRWMEPVARLVALYQVDEISFGGNDDIRVEPGPPPPALEIARAFDELGGKWSYKLDWLSHCDWTAVSDADRSLLRPVFLRHVDLIVRRDACRVFGQWNDTDALVELANDHYDIVRHQAMYELEDVPKSQAVAELAWSGIADGSLGGDSAAQALSTWCKHTTSDVHAQLVQLALNDTRQHLRWTALNEMEGEKVQDVQSLLDTEPAINWALHTAVLDDFDSIKRRPAQLERFADVDDLNIAIAYARLTEY